MHVLQMAGIRFARGRRATSYGLCRACNIKHDIQDGNVTMMGGTHAIQGQKRGAAEERTVSSCAWATLLTRAPSTTMSHTVGWCTSATTP